MFYRMKVDRVLSDAVEVFSARHASAAKYSWHVSNRPKYPNRPSELNPSGFFVRAARSCTIDKELREQSRSQRSGPFTLRLDCSPREYVVPTNWASLWIALINDSTVFAHFFVYHCDLSWLESLLTRLYVNKRKICGI